MRREWSLTTRSEVHASVFIEMEKELKLEGQEQGSSFILAKKFRMTWSLMAKGGAHASPYKELVKKTNNEG
jgi:hypothetical protein